MFRQNELFLIIKVDCDKALFSGILQFTNQEALKPWITYRDHFADQRLIKIDPKELTGRQQSLGCR